MSNTARGPHILLGGQFVRNIRVSDIRTLSGTQIKCFYLIFGYIFNMSIAPNALLLLTAPQLGQLLIATRKRHKLTQASVASRVGLSQNRISHLEQHPDEISVKQLLSWCSALELELRLGERDPSAPSILAEW